MKKTAPNGAVVTSTNRNSGLNLHIHDVVIRRHQLVPHLRHLLERDVGFLQVDHDVLQIDIALTRRKICGHFVGFGLGSTDLIDRALQYRSEVGAIGRRDIAGRLAAGERGCRTEFGEHLVEFLGVDSHGGITLAELGRYFHSNRRARRLNRPLRRQ